MCHKNITQDEKVILKEVLSVLSKSSPYAVSTERNGSILTYLCTIKSKCFHNQKYRKRRDKL
jgi:hypothetical protein